jgi:hypothetical protein
MGANISNPTTRLLLESQCYVALIAWYTGSRLALRYTCRVALGLFVLVEMLIASMTAIMRITNFFLPGIAHYMIVYEFYGICYHLLIVIAVSGNMSKNPYRTKGVVLLAHAMPLTILLLFSILLKFQHGPYPIPQATLVWLIATLWALFSCIYMRNGICCPEPKTSEH